MLTPQEVQEKTFIKAVFGGYDMQTVDDFIDVLSADYNTLYNENTVLKSKMKVLVERLEEYRSQEDSMKKALLAAQRTADELVANTQKKCARAVQDAQQAASDKVKRQQAAITAEEDRIEKAREEVSLFISQLQEQVSQTVQSLEQLKAASAQHVNIPERPRAYDYESEADDPAAIARTIERNMEKIVGDTSSTASAPQPGSQPVTDETRILPPVQGEAKPLVGTESGRQKYNLSELQFGSNYSPKN